MTANKPQKIRPDQIYVAHTCGCFVCGLHVNISKLRAIQELASHSHIHWHSGIFFTNKTTLSNKTYSLVADMQRDLHLVDCWTWSCLSEHLQNYWYATCNRWQNSHGSNAWLANKSSLQHQVQIPMQLGHQHLRRQRRESDNSVDPKWYLVSKF